MSNICPITDKGPQFGNNVSHSRRRTRRKWNPNMQVKTFELNGQKVRMKMSAKGIRTLKKKGIIA